MNDICVDWEPFPYQQDYLDDTSRFKLIRGGRRVGKTELGWQDCFIHANSVPDGLTMWVAPTFQNAGEVGFATFEKYYDDIKPLIHHVHPTQLKITWKNKHKTFFKGADKPESLRGRGLTKLLIDEAAFVRSGVYQKTLRPALSDRQGVATLISSPNGYNWFYELDIGENVWSKYYWPSTLNPLMTHEEIESVKHEISEIEYRQEYMAEYITRAGRVWPEFTRDNIIDTIPESWGPFDYGIGADFGYNTTSIGFYAFKHDPDLCIRFHEIVTSRKSFPDVIKQDLLPYCESINIKPNQFKVGWTDPAGNASEYTSGVSPVKELKNIGFKIKNQKNLILPTVELVRSMIRTATGERRFYITSECDYGKSVPWGYQYKLNREGFSTGEPLKDGKYDHGADEMRYFISGEFPRYTENDSISDQYDYSGSVEIGRKPRKCLQCRSFFLSLSADDLLCGSCSTSPI